MFVLYRLQNLRRVIWTSLESEKDQRDGKRVGVWDWEKVRSEEETG